MTADLKSPKSLRNIADDAEPQLTWEEGASREDLILAVRELRRLWKKEQEYSERLVHDVGLLFDAADAVVLQRGMTITAGRRILRIALNSIHYGIGIPVRRTAVQLREGDPIR